MCAKSGRHGCDEVRNQEVNLNTPDYINKVNAFFEYAKYDPDMVSLACHVLFTFQHSYRLHANM